MSVQQPTQPHTIICGLGRVGAAIAEQLTIIGEAVIVIDPKPRASLAAKMERLGIPVLEDDACRPETLHAAYITRAKSLICTMNGDLLNLETGLLARDLNPAIRLVLRLFSESIAEKTQGILDNYAALSVSKVAGPVIAMAGLSNRLRNAFRVGDHLLLLAEIEITTQQTIGDIRHSTVILHHPNDAAPQLFPDPEVQIRKGDILLVVTSFEQFHHIDPAALLPKRGISLLHPRHFVHWLMLRVGSLPDTILSLDRRLAILGSVLLTIVLVSMYVFHTFLNLSYIDAWYFVVTIVTTVGFGDFTLAKAGPALKIYGTFLMLSGAVLMASLFAIITDAIVGTRISRLLGPRALPVSDHFILCGLGSVGFRVLQELHRHHIPVVAIENNPANRFVTEVRRLGVPLIIASATELETLRLARAEYAVCIICCTSNDVINIETALNARSLAPNLRVVLRLFEQEMAHKMERFFQIHSAYSAAILSAPAFAAAALDSRVIHSFVAGKQWLLVSRFTIEPGSRLVGLRLSQVREIFHMGTLHYTPLGGSPVFQPAETIELAPGDQVIFIGNKEALGALEVIDSVQPGS